VKASVIKRNEVIRKNRREEECGRQPDRAQAVLTATKLRRRNKNGNGNRHKEVNRTGKVSTDEIIEALVAENGMLTLAAKRLKISYNTLKKYIGKDPKIQEAIIFIEEHSLDLTTIKELLGHKTLTMTLR
jgi:transcriptional regulator with GAF, ATPase, and Fis domain